MFGWTERACLSGRSVAWWLQPIEFAAIEFVSTPAVACWGPQPSNVRRHSQKPVGAACLCTEGKGVDLKMKKGSTHSWETDKNCTRRVILELEGATGLINGHSGFVAASPLIICWFLESCGLQSLKHKISNFGGASRKGCLCDDFQDGWPASDDPFRTAVAFFPLARSPRGRVPSRCEWGTPPRHGPGE